MNKTLTNQLIRSADQKTSARKAADNKLVGRWESTGLLEGLDGSKKRNMARLLENEAGALSGLLREASTDPNVRGFLSVAFPMVRRVLDKMQLEDIVSVQPLDRPSGMVYFLDYVFGTNKGGASASGVPGAYASGSSIYGNTFGPNQQNPETFLTSGSGGMYDWLSVAYSRREIVSTNTYTAYAETATLADVCYDDRLSSSAAAGTLKKIRIESLWTSASTGLGDFSANPADTSLLRAWHILSASSTATSNSSPGVPIAVDNSSWVAIRGHNRRVGANIEFMVIDNTSAFTSATGTVRVGFPRSVGSAVALTGYQVTPQWESDFLGSNTAVDIPEINFDISGVAIESTTRKLRARWSQELAQDINAYHSVDAEDAMTQLLSDHIAVEIQSEVLSDLLQHAGAANYFWSRQVGKFLEKTDQLMVFQLIS